MIDYNNSWVVCLAILLIGLIVERLTQLGQVFFEHVPLVLSFFGPVLLRSPMLIVSSFNHFLPRAHHFYFLLFKHRRRSCCCPFNKLGPSCLQYELLNLLLVKFSVLHTRIHEKVVDDGATFGLDTYTFGYLDGIYSSVRSDITKISVSILGSKQKSLFEVCLIQAAVPLFFSLNIQLFLPLIGLLLYVGYGEAFDLGVDERD